MVDYTNINRPNTVIEDKEERLEKIVADPNEINEKKIHINISDKYEDIIKNYNILSNMKEFCKKYTEK